MGKEGINENLLELEKEEIIATQPQQPSPSTVLVLVSAYDSEASVRKIHFHED